VYHKGTNNKWFCEFAEAGHECFVDNIKDFNKSWNIDCRYHEMSGHGIPCVCGRHFGDPDAAAAHMFCAPDDGTSIGHRCGGIYEDILDMMLGAILPSTTIPKLKGKSEADNDYYVIKFSSLEDTKQMNVKLVC
jgi:hypothetical protein